MEGTIINFSDSGSKPKFFAVIQVVKTHSLIVPVDKLEVVKSAAQEGNA